MADLSKYKPPRRHPGGGPVSVYNDMSGAFIEGALNNGFGRPVNIQYDGPVSKVAFDLSGLGNKAMAIGRLARMKGRRAALNTYGQLGDHGMELAGLGMLAAPVAHDLISDPQEESAGMHKMKTLTELAGLGVLAVPSLRHLRKP